MSKTVFFTTLLLLNILGVYNFCSSRPAELINAELYCEEEIKDGIFDRIENTAKSFFNKAKQELGLKVDNLAEPKKCEHYVCIFDRLEMMNQLKLPDLSLMQKWINKNVDENVVQNLNDHVSNCFKMLATSAVNIQNTCEIASRLMMCMHADEKCEIFKFP